MANQPRRYTARSLLLAGLALLWALHAVAAPPTPDRETLLVGLILGDREVGTLEVVRTEEDDGSFLLPLEPLADLAGFQANPLESGAVRLVTPLGPIRVGPEELVVIDGRRYLSDRVLRERLSAPVTFDTREFSLRLDLPWSPGTALSEPDRPVRELTPDAEPPWVGLSVFRTDVRYTRRETGESSWTGATDLEGRLADGWWQVRYEDDFLGDREPRLRDYAWIETRGRWLQLVGHQRVQLHPLLPLVELTGLQLAFTDQDLSRFVRTREPRELLPRRLRPRSTFRGEGPPAGVVELQVDGVLVAREPIGLDGLWELHEVPMPSRRLARVENLLYDRHNLQVPVEVREELLSPSDLLLPRDAVVHQGGVGRGGNVVDRALGSVLARDDEEAGFYQWRHGLTDRWTLEAAVQQVGGRTQTVAGAVARLGNGWLVSAGLGAAHGDLGYELSLERRWQRWRLFARSETKPPGFQRTLPRSTFDHAVELGWSLGTRLDAALLARSRRSLSERSEFVLPALRWRPHRSLGLRARPDADGDYDVDVSYRPHRRLRLAVRADDRTVADLLWRISDRTAVSFTGELGGAERHSALVRWQGRGRFRPQLHAGPILNGAVGGQVGVAAELLPGLLARIEVVDDPVVAARTGRGAPRWQIGLTADLAVSRGRLVAGRSRSLRDDRGAVAGRLRIADDGRRDGWKLGGAAVLIDGIPRARTRRDGSYFLGSLEPGIYRLELDPEELPVELAPTLGVRVVRVAAGGVTRADFELEPRYGLAGRVRDAHGEPVEGVEVDLVSSTGDVLTTAVTDRFGLYRMDGVPPGQWLLRSGDARRPVVVVDDFLFGRDLSVEP